MEWLVVAGILSFLAGILFLSSVETLRRLGAVLNKPVAYIDEKISSIRILAGMVLVIVGGWIISVAFNYPELWYLHIVGIIALFFGLLYLFLPRWLVLFSKFTDQVIFSADEVILGARKGFGIVLIIATIYIFYVAYLTAR